MAKDTMRLSDQHWWHPVLEEWVPLTHDLTSLTSMQLGELQDEMERAGRKLARARDKVVVEIARRRGAPDAR